MSGDLADFAAFANHLADESGASSTTETPHHSPRVRSVIMLFMSGLNISNAHRRLYWGDAGFDASEAWTGVIRFPGWAAIPGEYDRSAARA